MSLENLSQEIHNRVEEEKRSNEELYSSYMDSFEEDLNADLEEFEGRLKSDMDCEVVIYERKILGSARSNSSAIVLEAEREVGESVNMRVLELLCSIRGDKRKEFIKKLLNKVRVDISPDVIYCSKDDFSLLKEITDVKIKKDSSIYGGFVAEDSNEGVVVDMSFELIANEIN